jgi:hypothetical protein
MESRFRVSVAAALCLVAANAGCAVFSRNEPLPSGTLGTQTVSATARVTALDLKTRLVTLQRPDGSIISFRAGDEVRNLGKVKVGDQVRVTYSAALAYEVKKAGTGAPGTSVATNADRAPLGDKPGGTIAQDQKVTATIVGIDKKAMMVTLRGPDGSITPVAVRDPKKLDKVAVGDLVEVTYTQAVGIQVEEADTR